MIAEDILALVAARRGLDLRDHRTETVRRGIDARIRATLSPSAEDYLSLVKDGDQDELDRLVEALTVPVTSFFRDRPVFDALLDRVVPALIDALPGRALLRAWAAGVATGEEAWSLAMCLTEACDRAVGTGFEIVASDMDDRSLEAARAALYSSEAAAAIPDALRQKYGTDTASGWSPRASLRERVYLSRHQLMGTELAPRAAVIASFHLVSVRNVLIYLERRLQAKLIERLAAVTEPGGALVLGSVEAPPALQAYYLPFPGVDPALRIFRRRGEHR